MIRNATRSPIALLIFAPLVGLVACGVLELPDGWEEAVPATDFESIEQGAADYDDPELGAVYISGNVDRLEVSHLASFPCTESLEGFQRVEGTQVDLLIQPMDLHPNAVAGSDCAVDIDFAILDLDEGTYHVSLYRRDNDQVDPDMELQLVGEGDSILGFAE